MVARTRLNVTLQYTACLAYRYQDPYIKSLIKANQNQLAEYNDPTNTLLYNKTLI
jgi:hypothetical protein